MGSVLDYMGKIIRIFQHGSYTNKDKPEWVLLTVGGTILSIKHGSQPCGLIKDNAFPCKQTYMGYYLDNLKYVYMGPIQDFT